AVRGGDDLAAPRGANELAREDRAQPYAAQPIRLGHALRLAARREGDVEMAEEPTRLGEGDLAVAQQVDQRGTWVHATSIKSTISSAISMVAPMTSPVTPPSRRVANQPSAIVAAATSPNTTRPATPSRARAITAASASAPSAPAGRRPARNIAPWPSWLAAGKTQPASGGSARARAGAAISARQRVGSGSSDTA